MAARFFSPVLPTNVIHLPRETDDSLSVSKGFPFWQNTTSQCREAVRARVLATEQTKFFLDLLPTSVSRLMPEGTPKSRLKNVVVLVSTLKPGYIFATP